MDLTPQVMKDVQFSEARRGYDPAEVDEFLERIGRAVGQLRQRVADAESRAGATPVAGGEPQLHDPDRAVQRMLAAAQETADRVVHDAESDAVEVRRQAESHAVTVTAEAEQKARRLVTDAEAQAERIKSGALAEARRLVEETRAPLVAEVESLRAARGDLEADVERFEAHLARRRSELTALTDALAELASSDALEPPAPPQTTEIASDVTESSIDLDAPGSEQVPEPGPEPVIEPEPESVVVPEPQPEPEPEPEVEPEAVTAADPDDGAGEDTDSTVLDLTGRDDARADESRAEDSGDVGDVATGPGEVIRGAFADAPADGGDATLDFYEAGGDAGFDAGDDTGGDSFLDELRRAVDDDDPLGRPDDDADRAMAAFFDQDDEEPKGRFRRR